MFSIDIETIPNTALIDSLPEPEVALGNTKDPDKIEDKKRAARQKQIDNMALNPFYGRICSYATWGLNQGFYTIDEISDAAEIELINKVFSLLRFDPINPPSIITWNGFTFDIPFLYKRAVLLSVPLPSSCPGLCYYTKKYTHFPHCDLKQELSNWQTNDYMRLEEASRMLLGEGKADHDFSQFVSLIESGRSEEIGLYNLKDAELTYKLYEKLSPYLF